MQVAIIARNVNRNNPEVVTNMIVKSCESKQIECHIIDTKLAWVTQNDLEKGVLTISFASDEDKDIEFDISQTICFVRAGALANEAGLAIFSSFEIAGAMMINDRQSMMVCNNKMSSYLRFARNNIQTPRTSMVSNESSLKSAHESIGNRFPVIIKTITGTQGIGVSIAKDYESLISNIQSLWKFNAELLIQEYLNFEFDVRSLVVDGKVIASTKRMKPKNDFRSNRHRGATTAPYKLSEEEHGAIIAAARSVDARLVGVDHVKIKDQLYILECNGSPGIGSKFEVYDDKKTLGEMSNNKIVNRIVDHFTDEKNKRYTFSTECGYVESLHIDGLDPIRCKMDTGNGTKASMLYVDEIRIKGSTIEWSLDNKQFKNKLHGYSYPEHINKMDERPIVHLDIHFNNRYYTEVPFGLTTQTGKSEILVNRELLTRFKVHVNPNRRFVLTDFVERNI